MIDFQELSKNGDFHHKTVEKNEFLSSLKEFNFSVRDLRMILRLAETRRTRQPALLLRPSSKCFIFDIGNIQLLCFSHKCLIFKPEDKGTKNFIDRLHQKFSGADSEEFKEFSMQKVLKLLKQDSNQELYQNFEHVILETALENVVSKFRRHFNIMKPALEMLLQQTEENPETRGLKKLLAVKNSLAQFDQSLEHIRKIIENLLSNDKDMLSLYLNDSDKEDEVEYLLESSYAELDEIETENKILTDMIEDTEQFISAHMDSVRNEIMRLSLFLEIGAFIMAFGAVVGGIFGMNLTNSLEADPHAFSIVCFSLLVAMVGMLAAFWKKILKLKADTSSAQRFTLLKSFFTYVDDLEYHVLSKKIEKPEFKVAVEQVTGLNISEKESEFLFQMVDTNKDGFFDVEGEHKLENTK
eukprot:GFUD01020565.1.p1 GENE.GFUD01020565.1~~GFUD01020565.1.p1  ORF type:complete len:412 (+),score=123.55 GFUD01020565.1:27-1262(+)